MRSAMLTVVCVALLAPSNVRAQDWPQWLGANRDGKAGGFKEPKSWPKELTKKWKVTVGDGVATPALVGDRLYVFTRQEGQEIVRCLDASNGKEVWQDKYATGGAEGPARSFSGPRCSPTVAEGKVVTLGVRGILSCYDAASGKLLWRKDDFRGSYPRFFTSSSPLIVDGLCIAQLGGGRSGAIVAYDLAKGEQKWKWTGDSPAYASPVLMTVGGTKVVIAETETKIVGVSLTDGKLLWETSYAVRGRGYNASTPVAEGQTLVYSGSGRGTKAVKLEKSGDSVKASEVWSNDNSVQFNTPIIKDGMVYGLSSSDSLFCINGKDGKTVWTTSLGGGGGRGRGGYGSIVDAGSVLLALTPRGQLLVFQPGGKEYKQLASYKVADGGTYAYPVLSGNRIFIKDSDSLTLWTME